MLCESSYCCRQEDISTQHARPLHSTTFRYFGCGLFLLSREMWSSILTLTLAGPMLSRRQGGGVESAQALAGHRLPWKPTSSPSQLRSLGSVLVPRW